MKGRVVLDQATPASVMLSPYEKVYEAKCRRGSCIRRNFLQVNV